MSRAMTLDQVAVVLLMRGKQKELSELSAKLRGEVACPDCGDPGPHDVSHDSFDGDEFVCRSCGMQHPLDLTVDLGE